MPTINAPLWEAASAQECGEFEPVLVQYGITAGNAKLLKNTRAHTNRVYLVEPSDAQPFVVRAVKLSTYGVVLSKPEHLDFEIELLDYLESVSFDLSPRVRRNRQAKPITVCNGGQIYVAFEMLPGELAGSFNDLCAFTAERRASFFAAVGRTSRALSHFQPLTPCQESTLADLCRLTLTSFDSRLNLPGEAAEIVMPHEPRIRQFAEQACRELDACRYAAQPRQVVHFDLHAGNTLFNGNALSAVLDWDWARMDCRISDLASCLAMTCYQYGGADDGVYNQEQMQQGVRAFRTGFGASEFSRDQESALLQAAFKAYILIQFRFTMEFYTRYPTDDNLIDMTHFLRLITVNDHDRLMESLR